MEHAVYVFAGCAALNSVNLGFDIGVNSAVGLELEADLHLDHGHLQMFIGSLDLFAVFGALFASALSDRLGRRLAFAAAAAAFEVGTGILVLSHEYTTLMTGRLFLGLGIGFGLAADPVYISEISPARHRGRLVTWSEVGINVGILLGFLVGYAFSNLPPGQAWRSMFAAGAVMPFFMCILVKWVMPESPRWLVMKGRLDEAAKVLEAINAAGADISAIIGDIQQDIAQEVSAGVKVRWSDLLCPKPAVKRMLLAGVGVAICQQLCGIDAVLYFMLFIIQRAGIRKKSDQFMFLILVGVLKLLLIPIAGRILDKAGRRPTILGSCAGMVIALLVMSGYFFVSAATGEGAPQLALMALIGYMCSFSLGMGPGAWLIPSEVFPTTLRAKAMSLATLGNRSMATVMACSALSMANALSWGGYFLLLALVIMLVALFVSRYVPETKGKTLEQLTIEFCQEAGEKEMLTGSHTSKIESQHGAPEAIGFSSISQEEVLNEGSARGKQAATAV